MRRRRRVEPRAHPAWLDVLAILGAESEYDGRVDAVLATAAAAAGVPDAFLYLLDPGARRLHLERSLARAAADPDRRPSPSAASTEGGAEWSAPTPPLEVLHTPEDDLPRIVATPIGPLWSVPLRAADGSLLGLLQAGPVRAGDVPEALSTVSVPLAFVVERARREEALRMRLAATTAQLEASQRLAGSALDVDRFVALLLDLAMKATRSEAGFVGVADSSSGALTVRAERGMAPGFIDDVDLSPTDGLFDWSPAAEGGALILSDLDAAARLGMHSVLAVPLVEGSEPLGVIALVSYGAGGTFDEQSLELLETFAEQIRLMLHNARLFDAFSDRYLQTVKGLARSLDARRARTRGHHDATARAARAIATAMALSGPEVRAIETAGLVHDVGLAASVSEEAAFDSNIEHPLVGASMIEQIPLHPSVASGVATHHEWFDGWGFPQGLTGDAIPVSGRILGVAEFLVEMSTGEAVRPAWPAERLASELLRRRGSQFDPEITDVAIRLVGDDALGLDERPDPDSMEDHRTW